jgi:EAL domain-containing protein (putative c-di-GMP-specific phosphodiesterase class I)/FixJ family two-component response regulator
MKDLSERPPAGVSSPGSALDETLRELCVLVVDDKSFVRTMTGRVLQKIGIENIVYAANGREAVNYMRRGEHRVHVVFCDLMMPDMDGVEVIRHAADLQYKPSFVFISGETAALLGTAVDMGRARGLPVLGAIEKPVSVASARSVLAAYGKANQPAVAARPVSLSVADLILALDRDEIILHYQPKINLRRRTVEGFETLARWQHPDYGLIPPAQFISLAEEGGVIEPLTDRVLATALKQCAIWNNVGLVTKLSVNLSAHLLVDLRMPDRIAKEVAQHGVDPKQIVLEITETGVFRDTADTLDILARLHMKGFVLSIDDFGTGYSSMEQLRRVPFAELKIDKAFVTGALQNAKSRAILQSSANLGKRLGLSVVAEGAETQEDWDMLSDLDCDMVQGYFVSRPMSVDAVNSWAQNWAATH